MADIADILGTGVSVVSGSDQGASKPGNFLQATTVTSILYAISMFNGSAGLLYLMVFDSATVPADGTVSPKLIVPVAAGAAVPNPMSFGGTHFFNGICAVASSTWGTAAGNLTKTISTTASCVFRLEIAPTD